MMRHPCAASALAAASPMPELAPVMTATRGTLLYLHHIESVLMHDPMHRSTRRRSPSTNNTRLQTQACVVSTVFQQLDLVNAILAPLVDGLQLARQHFGEGHIERMFRVDQAHQLARLGFDSHRRISCHPRSNDNVYFDQMLNFYWSSIDTLDRTAI
jgi:hypothetical protein